MLKYHSFSEASPLLLEKEIFFVFLIVLYHPVKHDCRHNEYTACEYG